MPKNISSKFLKSVLEYNSKTGVFFWKCRLDVPLHVNRRLAGRIAGHVADNGYIHIVINNEPYLAHQLAWLYMTGEWPKDQVDHRDTIKINNKWDNLREANKFQNSQNTKIQKNNETGYKGITFNNEKQRFSSRIMKQGKRVHLGYFDTPERAYAAYCQAAADYHGEFARVA